MKKIFALFLVLSFISSFALQNLSFLLPKAEAQTLGPCVNLSYNMTVGSHDYQTEGQVTQLQVFLNSTGFMNYPATGYFGSLTQAAVAKYQTANQIYPNAGYVGPLTRASINQDTCSTYVPSTPSSNPSYYCDINGVNYNNQQDYINNCKQVIINYTYVCPSNGQTYTSESAYNNNCNYNQNNPPQNNQNTYYCSLNGQTYYNLNNYNLNCRSQNSNNNTLPICNVGVTYANTKTCICPSGYTFANVNGGYYQCDNSQNYACTTIYVYPWATSSQYDRCHYQYYCPSDNLYHNDPSYCGVNNQNNPPQQLPICNLNTAYQTTKSCVCPSGYTFMNTYTGYQCDNSHDYMCTMIYVAPWATSSQYDRCHYAYYCPYDNLYHNDASYCQSTNQPNTNYCVLGKEYQGGGIVATNDCVCPANSYKISTGNYGEIYRWICQPTTTY